jgi:hypothetical protein
VPDSAVLLVVLSCGATVSQHSGLLCTDEAVLQLPPGLVKFNMAAVTLAISKFQQAAIAHSGRLCSQHM